MNKFTINQLNHNDNQNHILYSHYFNEPLLENERTFQPFYVWNYKFIKISYYSTQNTTIEIKFRPAYTLPSIQLTENKHNLLSYTDNVITCDDDVTLTVPPNKYNNYVIPIRGEYLHYKITKGSGGNDTHTYSNVCLSKDDLFIKNH
tara:strand:- start:1532 stop:1972 length:441 start_codon:yes stop_codon:yes gene_type:complete